MGFPNLGLANFGSLVLLLNTPYRLTFFCTVIFIPNTNAQYYICSVKWGLDDVHVIPASLFLAIYGFQSVSQCKRLGTIKSTHRITNIITTYILSSQFIGLRISNEVNILHSSHLNDIIQYPKLSPTPCEEDNSCGHLFQIRCQRAAVYLT